MRIFFRTSVLSFLFLFFLVPSLAHGMAFDSVSETISFSLRPERPKPYDSVTVGIESYSMDLASSEISWFLEGKLLKKVRGEKTLVFKVGAPGTVSNLDIVIVTVDGAEFRKNITIRPAEVTLLWESEGYTPPFYRGKSRVSYQGTIKVAAVPNIVKEGGVRVPSNNLVYTWEKDGRVVPDQSGYGRTTFRTEGTIPIRPVTVTVEVATPDSLYVAESSVTINPERPTVLLYENSPLYGLLFNATVSSGVALSSNEIIVGAIPFYFDTEARSGDNLAYEWSVNAFPVRGYTSNLVLRRAGTEAGKTAVSLKVSNTDRIFQFASNETTITLPEGTSGSSFLNN